MRLDIFAWMTTLQWFSSNKKSAIHSSRIIILFILFLFSKTNNVKSCVILLALRCHFQELPVAIPLTEFYCESITPEVVVVAGNDDAAVGGVNGGYDSINCAIKVEITSDALKPLAVRSVSLSIYNIVTSAAHFRNGRLFLRGTTTEKLTTTCASLKFLSTWQR